MNYDMFYWIGMQDFLDVDLSGLEFELWIEVVGKKFLSDGLLIDDDGNVFIIDVEN